MSIFKTVLLLIGVFGYVRGGLDQVTLDQKAVCLKGITVESLVYGAHESYENIINPIISWTIYKNYGILFQGLVAKEFKNSLYGVSGKISENINAVSMPFEKDFLDDIGRIKGLKENVNGDITAPGLIHLKDYEVVVKKFTNNKFQTANFAYLQTPEADLVEAVPKLESVMVVIIHEENAMALLKTVPLYKIIHLSGSKFTAALVKVDESTDLVKVDESIEWNTLEKFEDLVTVDESADVVIIKENELVTIGKVTRAKDETTNEIVFTVFGKEFFESLDTE